MVPKDRKLVVVTRHPTIRVQGFVPRCRGFYMMMMGRCHVSDGKNACSQSAAAVLCRAAYCGLLLHPRWQVIVIL